MVLGSRLERRVTAIIAAVIGVRLRGREVVALAVLGAGLVLVATSAQPGRDTSWRLSARAQCGGSVSVPTVVFDDVDSSLLGG